LFQRGDLGRTAGAAGAAAGVVVTMPPWPGSDEAYEVEGKWEPTVGKRG